jgi:hypothetical protein
MPDDAGELCCRYLTTPADGEFIGVIVVASDSGDNIEMGDDLRQRDSEPYCRLVVAFAARRDRGCRHLVKIGRVA